MSEVRPGVDRRLTIGPGVAICPCLTCAVLRHVGIGATFTPQEGRAAIEILSAALGRLLVLTDPGGIETALRIVFASRDATAPQAGIAPEDRTPDDPIPLADRPVEGHG